MRNLGKLPADKRGRCSDDFYGFRSTIQQSRCDMQTTAYLNAFLTRSCSLLRPCNPIRYQKQDKSRIHSNHPCEFRRLLSVSMTRV